jgi:hypothetical protein|tara:strand:+ start:1482 stop:1655 length:174 start_codon:yes stop_codon:yes gene_type:complete
MKQTKSVEGPITLYSPVHRGGTKDLDGIIKSLKKNKKSVQYKTPGNSGGATISDPFK